MLSMLLRERRDRMGIMWPSRKPAVTDVAVILAKEVFSVQALLLQDMQNYLNRTREDFRVIEFTYYSLAAMTFAFFSIARRRDRTSILDQANLLVLEKCLPYCGEGLDLRSAITEYQHRYADYSPLMKSLFSDPGLAENSVSITLAEMVLGFALEEPITADIYPAVVTISPLLVAHILDFLECSKAY